MLAESEAFIEQINVDLKATRMVESYAHNVAGERKNRVQELEMQMEEANKLEMAAVRQKMGLMEMTTSNQRGELEEIEHWNNMAKEEPTQVIKLAESLKSNLETVKEEMSGALNKEKLATSTVQTLPEEKTKLMKEMKNYRDKMEKSKKAMESLASALHQFSAKVREAKEKHSWSEKEHQSYKTKLEDLRSVLKATNDKYETCLVMPKPRLIFLQALLNRPRMNTRIPKLSGNEKKLVNLMKQSEEEASASKEEVGQLKESLKEAEFEGVVRENEELRAREAASLRKVEELAKLLEEATVKRKTKDCDLLPKLELPSKQSKEPQKENSLGVNDGSKEDGAKVENWNVQVKDSDEVELEVWESCEIGKNEFLPKMKPSILQEVESKPEVSEGLIDEINGSTKNVDDDGNSSPKKQQQNKKYKKKTLLYKLGTLLKKESNN
ncbi:hypothetical protein Goklo_006626 [Gossypium klotzschianum]|uniref:WEB family protein n=1 Tax=Gossypium klotzschianum TaxID=34286 RepID=A0A7J8VI96_9ROSI|nr:hypothetical protein [Gossypium klotzschianum]